MPFYTHLQDLFASFTESLILDLDLLSLVYRWGKFYHLLCVGWEFLSILNFIRVLRKFNVNI